MCFVSGEIPAYVEGATALGSQPKALDHLPEEDLTIVATVKEVWIHTCFLFILIL